MLALRLLATPELTRADGQRQLLSEKDAAVLALAVLAAPITRQRVAALVWPGDSSKAVNNLRQRLHRLARWAGEEVVQPGTLLQLAAGVRHDLSLPADAPSQAAGADGPLVGAGALLGSFQYGRDELGLWVQGMRRRWLAAAEDRHTARITQLESAGRLAEALQIAHGVIAQDPLSEHASRLLMRLHHRRGDRGSALAEFERLKKALHDQLGEAPSGETLALVRQVAQGQEAAPPSRLALPLALRHPPRTVGREAAVRAAQASWVQHGLVLLQGPAGIGKSRLVADLMRPWGITVHVVCRAGHQGSALGLLGLLGEALAPAAGAFLGAEERAWLHWLQHPGQGALPGEGALPAKAQQLCAALLAAAEAGGASAVAIEDLHHADEASLQALLACWTPQPLEPGSKRPRGLRWLASVRDDPLPAPLVTWLDRQAAGAYPVVVLEPLAADASQALVQSLEVAVTAPQAAALHRHCGGHPLFMLQVLRQLQLAGELGEGRWPARLPMPAEAMVGASQRLLRAEPQAQQLAFAAALCGVDFSPALMCKLLGCTPLALVAPWRQLEALHLFGNQGFVHDLVREAVLSAVPQAMAPLLHAQIAQELEAAGAEPARCAAHWEAAGHPVPAARAFEAAAARAEAVGLPTQAIAWLERAAAQHADNDDRAAVFDTRYRRGQVMLRAGSIEAAAAAAVELKAAATNPQQRVMAAELLTGAKIENLDEGALAEAESMLALAAAVPDDARAQPLLARCRLRHAGALALAGRRTEAHEELLRLSPQAQALTAADRFDWVYASASVLASLGRRREAVAMQREELARAQQRRNPADASFCAGFCATHLGYLGLVDEAIDIGRLARSLGWQAGVERGAALIDDMGLAGNLGDSGRFDEALALGEAVIAGLREIGHHAWAVNASNDRAAIFARLGRFDLARQLVADPVPEAPRWLQAARCLVRSRLLRMQGLDGREEMARAEALFGQDGLSDMYPRLKVGVEAARVSSPVLAEERAAEAVAWAQQHEHVAFARYASMVRVESLQRQGRLDEAAAEAAALAADPGALTQAIGYYLPELVQVLADALAAAGQAAAAQALVAQGAGWITRCAREHVSPPYRESFVHRNPINARLLARAGQAAAAVTGG